MDFQKVGDVNDDDENKSEYILYYSSLEGDIDIFPFFFSDS